MQAIILAAGQGIRMRPLTNNICKPMLQIKGKPILEYTLANLPEEISEIIFIIGYKGDLIRTHFGNEYKNKRIRYVLQKDLNGSAAALRCAKDFLKEKFLVLNGDDLYCRPDLKNLINNDSLAVLAKEVDNPGHLGALKTDDNGYLLEIIENPKENYGSLVNAGAYFLNRKFFDYEMVKKSTKISEREFGLPQTLVKMTKDYKVKVEKAKFWQPIGYPKDLKKAEEIIDRFSSRPERMK